jgi:hypothetical protein
MKPNKPIAERLNPSSFSQADIAEPIIIQGNPLAMPKMKTVMSRLSA